MEYKGIYYGDDEKVQHYYEGGAHFKYSQLYKILSLIAEQKEKKSLKKEKLLSSSKKITNKKRNIIFNINQINKIASNQNRLIQYKTIINTTNLNNNKNISINNSNQLSSLIINNYFMNKQIIKQNNSSERNKSFQINQTRDSYTKNYKTKLISRNIQNLSQGKLNAKIIANKKNTALNFNSYHKTQNSKYKKDMPQKNRVNNFLLSRINKNKDNKLNETSIQEKFKYSKNNLSASNSIFYEIFTKRDKNKNIKTNKIKSPKFKKISKKFLFENSKEYNGSYTKARTISKNKNSSNKKIKTKKKKGFLLSKTNTKSNLFLMHIHDYLLNELNIWNKAQMNKKKNSKYIRNGKIINSLNSQGNNNVKDKDIYDNIYLNFKHKKSRNYKNVTISNKTSFNGHKTKNMNNNGKNFSSQIYCNKNSTNKKFNTSKNNKYNSLTVSERSDTKNSNNNLFGSAHNNGIKNKKVNINLNTGFKIKNSHGKIINVFSEKRAWNPMKLMSLNDIRIFNKKKQ